MDNSSYKGGLFLAQEVEGAIFNLMHKRIKVGCLRLENEIKKLSPHYRRESFSHIIFSWTAIPLPFWHRRL